MQALWIYLLQRLHRLWYSAIAQVVLYFCNVVDVMSVLEGVLVPYVLLHRCLSLFRDFGAL